MNVTRLGQGNEPTKENLILSLQEAAQAVEDGRVNARKGIVLLLDDNDGHFDIRFFNSGMKMSECVTVTECGKMRFLGEMGYV